MMESSAWVFGLFRGERTARSPRERAAGSRLFARYRPCGRRHDEIHIPITLWGWRWGWRRGVSPGARFTFPKTGTHANCLKAHARTPRRNSGASAALRARMTAADPSIRPQSIDAGDMDCKAAETIPGLCAALAELLPSGDRERAVLLAFDGEGGNVATNIARDAADTTGARAVLVVAPDAAAATAAAAAGLPHVRPDCAGSCVRPQFAAAAAILALGADVLLVGRGAVLRGPNPLRNVPETRGADVEGIPADLNALGAVVGMSDPPMGWSQYSQSMVVPHLSSSLVVMHATEESTRLAKWLGDGGGGDGSSADADVALSEELLMPAHDATQRSGATFRVLPLKCFKAHRGGGSVADAALASPGKPWRGASSKSVSLSGEDPNDLLQSSTFEAAKSVVLRDGPIGDADENGNCAAIEQKDRVGPQPRALRYVTPRRRVFRGVR